MPINTNIDPYWDDYDQATSVDGLTPRENITRFYLDQGLPFKLGN